MVSISPLRRLRPPPLGAYKLHHLAYRIPAPGHDEPHPHRLLQFRQHHGPGAGVGEPGTLPVQGMVWRPAIHPAPIAKFVHLLDDYLAFAILLYPNICLIIQPAQLDILQGRLVRGGPPIDLGYLLPRLPVGHH